MDLNSLLDALDRTSANLTKLEVVWTRASPYFPSGPSAGSPPEYDELCLVWDDLVEALPPIDGFRISLPLPNISVMGQSFIDASDIGVPWNIVYDEIAAPGKQLAEYRHRLSRARRQAVRKRLSHLSGEVERLLGEIVRDIDDAEPAREVTYSSAQTEAVREGISEIERLLGDAVVRRGRWTDLRRHLSFSQPHDWGDIHSFDWPSIREDVLSATFSETEPLPVENIGDLGIATQGDLSGAVNFRLNWEQLDSGGFERMLYELLRVIPGHSNVQQLTKENAPDRGRDLSLDRAIPTPTGETIHERVLVQAKHWRSKSVSRTEISEAVSGAESWTPPFNVVIIATSGHFTNDAVTWVEARTAQNKQPYVVLWAEPDLERLLSQYPEVAASYNLR